MLYLSLKYVTSEREPQGPFIHGIKKVAKHFFPFFEVFDDDMNVLDEIYLSDFYLECTPESKRASSCSSSSSSCFSKELLKCFHRSFIEKFVQAHKNSINADGIFEKMCK